MVGIRMNVAYTNKFVISFCLMCSDDREYSKLLCEACQRCTSNDLKKVKKLVERHKVNPNGEDVHCTIFLGNCCLIVNLLVMLSHHSYL